MSEQKISAASLEVEHLSFCYPGSREWALEDVSFSVGPGERLGLLGPNGAGKSTLMRVLCGYLYPENDRNSKVCVAGYDLDSHSIEIRERVGYLPEQVPLYTELRVSEHLGFRASIKRIQKRTRDAEVRRVCELTGLSDMMEVPIHRLSRGYRQRVGIADALLGSPPLVVLDEPTVGLDPNQVQAIRSLLKNLGGNQTLIFSSHILAEVEALCDRIVILSHGKVVADERVRDATATGRIHVEWLADTAEASVLSECAIEAWREMNGQSTDVPRWHEVDLDSPSLDEPVRKRGFWDLHLGADSQGTTKTQFMEGLGRKLAEQRVALVRLEVGRRRLEQRFARVTGFEGDAEDSMPAPSSVSDSSLNLHPDHMSSSSNANEAQD